jgi:hypothetical protein
MRFSMTILAVLAWLVLLAPQAPAHEGTHGVGLTGSVVSIAGDVLTLATEKSQVAVTLTEKTRVTSGAKAVGREALTSGVRVHVHGSRLPGGGFAAREVEIQPEGAGEPAQPQK